MCQALFCAIIQNLRGCMAVFVPAPNAHRLLCVKLLSTCFFGSAFFLSVSLLSVGSYHCLWLLCTEIVTTLAAQRPCALFPGSSNILKR